VPTFYFGEHPSGIAYTPRPSAYVIVPRADRDEVGANKIATVLTACGYHLPGGGIDPGESAEQAVIREMLEETGLAIECLRRIGDAIEMTLGGGSEGKAYQKRCVFYEGRLLPAPAVAAIEKDHELRWIPAADTQLFSHDVHRWAVEQWLSICHINLLPQE